MSPGRRSKNSLYSMSDAITVTEKEAVAEKSEEVYHLKTFSDIEGHENREAIESLASKGIIGGKGDGKFDPDSTMTRAEFTAIVTRGLGLSGKNNSVFTRVTAEL